MKLKNICTCDNCGEIAINNTKGWHFLKITGNNITLKWAYHNVEFHFCPKCYKIIKEKIDSEKFKKFMLKLLFKKDKNVHHRRKIK